MSATKLYVWEASWLLLVAGLMGLSGWAGRKTAECRESGHSDDSSAARSILPRIREPAPALSAADRLPQTLARLHSLNRCTLDPFNDFVWLAAVDEILAGLSAGELAAVFANAVKNTDAVSMKLAGEIHRYWAMKDPKAAFAVAEKRGPVSASIGIMRTAMDWPAEDLEAALAWAQANRSDPALKRGADTLLVDTLDRLAETDLSRAVEIYHGLDAEIARDTLLHWAERHGSEPEFRDRIIGLARTSGGDEELKTVLSKMMSNWAIGHPDEARAYLESGNAPAPAEAAAGYVEGLEHRNPAGAFDWWMSHHAADAEPVAGADNAMMNWVSSKPAEALDWLASQQSGPQRDALYAAAVTKLAANNNYAAAVQSLEEIGDPAFHEQARRSIDLLWSADDPDGAAKWRQDAGAKH